MCAQINEATKRGNGRLKTNALNVYDIIKQQIITCCYSPGQLLSEKEIVDELGTSRTPVREAINMLAGEGLLEIIPKKGFQISSLSIKRLREIYDVRLLLESEALRQAAPYLKTEDLNNMLELDKKIVKAYEDDKSASDIYAMGADIHLSIASHSRNDTLYYLIKQLRSESQRGDAYYLQQKLNARGDTEWHIKQQELWDNIRFCHGKIINCLIESNVEGAIEFLAKDLTSMKKLLTEL